jgi:hypothetical protein
MAKILLRLGYVRQGQLVAVTRDDLVGSYIGHTGPKTKEVLKKAMGGVLFIDEAYTLYRPENERDYGQEAIEILLQVMENQRDDLVVILAGYKDRMDTFFQSNPGISSRIAHHLDFPDYARTSCCRSPTACWRTLGLRLRPRRTRSVRRLPGRCASVPAALRQRAQRAQRARPRAAAPGQPPVRRARPRADARRPVSTIAAADIRASRVFSGG